MQYLDEFDSELKDFQRDIHRFLIEIESSLLIEFGANKIIYWLFKISIFQDSDKVA
jgi:hypothetical protein